MFGGDVMFGRTVESRIRQHGGEWPLALIASTLTNNDITVVNLESPFREVAAQTARDSLVLRGDPAGIASLQVSGVDVVSLANNHITDMGVTGLRDTFSLLSGAGIAYAGAGERAEDAEQAVIIERRGMKVGFLSYTYGVNVASRGVYYQTVQADVMEKQVQELKKQADAVIVLCHCGTEYAAKPTQSQVAFARAAVTAGASAYIGHHPHVPQPVEIYQGRPIIYSLGNLVFDQQPGGNRDRSALARLTLTGAAPTVLELLPYQIYSYGQPRLATEMASKRAVWELFSLPAGRWP